MNTIAKHMARLRIGFAAWIFCAGSLQAVGVPPVITLIEPTNTVLFTGSDLYVKAEVTDDVSVDKVVLRINGEWVSTLRNSDYEWGGPDGLNDPSSLLSNMTNGSYEVKIFGVDDQTNVSLVVVNVTVEPDSNLAPTVEFSDPATDLIDYPINTTVTINATANDPDGEFVEVELLQDGISIGTDTNAPYSFTSGILDEAGKTYLFELIATDNNGAVNALQTTRTVTTTNGIPRGNFELWTAHYDLSNDAASMTADPDGDLFNNLLEFAFGGDPEDGRDANRIRPTTSLLELNGTNTFAYSFRRLKDRSLNQLEYIIEVTEDLSSDSWDVYSGPLVISDVEDDFEIEAVTVHIDHSMFSPYYIRLKISYPDQDYMIYYIQTQADFDAYANYTFAPGDHILLKCGRIFNGMFSPKGSGEPGRPIIIGNYGSGSLPIINAMGVNDAGILLENVEQWEINGIEITNTDGTDNHQGALKGIYVLIDNPTSTVMNHIHIKNCYVHDVNGTTTDDDPFGAKRHGGIHIHTYGGAGDECLLNDVSIVSNTVENTGGVGIGNDSVFATINNTNASQTYLWTDLYVAHNYVDNTDRNNMIIRDSINPRVEYNVLANSSRENTGHSLFNFDTVGFVAQYNEGYGNVGVGEGDRGAYDADYNSMDTTFQYNYSHDNEWMIGIMNKFNVGVTIRYNISQNDKQGFIFYGFNGATGSQDVKVYNNTYYAGAGLSSGALVARNSVAKHTTFYNNIFCFENGASHADKVPLWEDVSFTNNAYVGIAPWAGEVGAVTSNILLVNPETGGEGIDMSDPNRLSGYRLQPGSDCIDAGISILGVNRDFWGNTVPAGAGTDIGAHEVQP